MTDPTPAWQTKLLEGYLLRMPTRLEEIERAIEAARQGGAEEAAALHQAVHRLHGSAGSYGLSELCNVLGAWDRELQERRLDTAEEHMRAVKEAWKSQAPASQ